MAKRKAAKKGNGRKRVSAVEFVRGWAKGGTADEVATRLGIGKQSLYLRGRTLKKAGVKLPRLKKAPRIDVDALNAILAQK